MRISDWSSDVCSSDLVKPWLPVGESHRALAVDVQEARPDSLLHWTRRVLALRNGSPALRAGAIQFLEGPDELLLFERTHGNERLLCAFNLGNRAAAWTSQEKWRPLLTTGGGDRKSTRLTSSHK